MGFRGGGVKLTPPQRILVFKYPSRDRVNTLSFNFTMTAFYCSFEIYLFTDYWKLLCPSREVRPTNLLIKEPIDQLTNQPSDQPTN